MTYPVAVSHAVALIVVFSAAVSIAQVSSTSSNLAKQPPFMLEKANKRPTKASRQLLTIEYEKLIKKNPLDAILLNNLAVLYYLDGRHYESQSLLRRAAEHSPDNAQIQVNLAAVYRKLFNPNLAIATLQRVLQKEPSQVRALPLLCEIYFSEERAKEAIICYESLMRSQDFDSLSAANLGTLLLEAKETKRALHAMEKADARFPDDAGILNVLGMALYYRKEYNQAEVTFVRAIELRPDVNILRYNLALAQMMTRKKGSAIEQYRYLQTADPELASRLYKEIFRDKLVFVKSDATQKPRI